MRPGIDGEGKALFTLHRQATAALCLGRDLLQLRERRNIVLRTLVADMKRRSHAAFF